MKLKLIFLLSIILFTNEILIGQGIEYSEKVEDAYLAPGPEFSPRNQGYTYSNGGFSITQVNIDSLGNNIPNDAANEPSFAIDLSNPLRMVIGWRQFDNIESNFRQAGLAISEDGGSSWQNIGPIEPGVFRSDPVLDDDGSGTFHYNSLGDDYHCDVFKTSELENWEDKTYAFGGDKQWMVIDKTANVSNGNIYANWKEQFSVCEGSFTRSLDGGASYEACTFLPDNPTRGTVAVGVDGEVYVAGGLAGSYYVARSNSAMESDLVPSWEQVTTVDLLGSQALYSGPNPAGMLGQVWIAADHSGTTYHGNVYLLSSTEKDNGDPADVMFSSSSDKGETWSTPIQINTDASSTNYQWFGTLSVAPNGRIDVVWLDTRDADVDNISSLYYSYSLDGGDTWSVNEKLSDEFDSHLGFPNQNKMGDYFHMISFNEGAHLAWAATFNGEQDIYYSFIENSSGVSAVKEMDLGYSGFTDIALFPNPSNGNVNLILQSKSAGLIKVRVLDGKGSNIGTAKNYLLNEGENTIVLDRSALGMPLSGLYFLRIERPDFTPTFIKLLIN